ncbi:MULTISPECIES: cytochrome P450 [unclassified Blastococcus]
MEAPLFDPTSEAFHRDRHGTYRRIRDRAPLLELPGPVPTVLVSRYADIDAVLRDRTVRMLPEGAGAPPWLGDGAAAEMFLGQMLFTDPPEHTRLRRVTSPAFRPRTVSRLHDAVDAAMDERVAVLREKGEFDAVADLAEHVPAVAVCTILGIPEEDWPALIRGAVDFVHVLSPLPPDADQLARTEAICQYYLDYFRDLVADRRRRPGDEDDFLTALIRAFDAGEISERELLVTAHSVLNAGFETTMSALANGLLGLLSHPAAWAALVADPGRSAAVVEEALRWEAPAQLYTRFAAEDLDLDSGRVAAGTVLVVAAGSGNRDERRFADPDAFDVDRPAQAHLSFSAGRHACIGAHLGRMELDIAFRKLAAAFPHLALAAEPHAVREPNPVFPTLRRLDVTVAP